MSHSFQGLVFLSQTDKLPLQVCKPQEKQNKVSLKDMVMVGTDSIGQNVESMYLLPGICANSCFPPA